MKSLITVFVLFTTFSYSQDAREIINHYLDTVSNGSIENWNKIKSIYSENESYYSQQDFEHKVNLLKPDKSNFGRSFVVPPYNNKYEIYEDSSFTQLLSTFYHLKDRSIIILGNNPPFIKQPPTRDEFFSIHLPVQISKLYRKSSTVELVGVKEFPLEGIFCYQIKITTKGRDYLLFINRETFLLEYWTARGDENSSILTRYTNYKKVDVFLIPMTERLINNGVVYFWSNTKKYLVNSDIDKEIFKYKGN